MECGRAWVLRLAAAVWLTAIAACGTTSDTTRAEADSGNSGSVPGDATAGDADGSREPLDDAQVDAEEAPDTADSTQCFCAGDPENQATLSWDCFCQAYSCDLTLSTAWEARGTIPFWGEEWYEYAGCSLMVRATRMGYDGTEYSVWDIKTGSLVGATLDSDAPFACPYPTPSGDTMVAYNLKAGTFPADDCERTGCWTIVYSAWPNDCAGDAGPD